MLRLGLNGNVDRNQLYAPSLVALLTFAVMQLLITLTIIFSHDSTAGSLAYDPIDLNS